jgi:endonuclease/exonuclease/phosphatase family metal-dependent hydrolase
MIRAGTVDKFREEARPGPLLRLASFNIQTGLTTSAYHEYVTGGWRHLLPSSRRLPNLARIAQLLNPFDIVGLQEVDGGGIRSHNIVQAQYLAHHANFPYWHNQVNRRFGKLALHSNGLLSRLKPSSVHDYKLPGFPGRGAIVARFKVSGTFLNVCCVHLALSRRARLKQVDFLAELIGHLPYVVVMGDFNCEPGSLEIRHLVSRSHLTDPAQVLETFPSWRPQKSLDHILVGADLEIDNVRILDCKVSDHLPIAMDVRIPRSGSAAR